MSPENNNTAGGRIVIGLDIGGTKLLGAVMDERGSIYNRLHQPTDAAGNEAIRDQTLVTLQELLRAAPAVGGPPAGIVIGVPGYANPATGVIVEATNIGVRDLPLGEIVAQAFDIPTLIIHDVKAAALGEARFGAGKGASYLAFLNVGTGISVGLVLAGRIHQGAAGRAGEIGHGSRRHEGPLCLCGRRGCLEALAAGPALARDARAAIADGRPSRIVALVDGAIERVTAETVAEAARQGDGLAIELLDRTADYLGEAIAGLVNILDLERVVVGGGLAQVGPLLLDRVKAAAARYMLDDYATSVAILPSLLGSDAYLLGAVAALREDWMG